MKTHYHLIKDLCPLKTTLSLVLCVVVHPEFNYTLLELLYVFVKARVYDLSVDLTNFFPGTFHIIAAHKIGAL